LTLPGNITSLSLTKEIQQTICKAEIKKGNHVAENFNYFFRGELDVISVAKSGYVSELEVKVSRADFRADAKKSKWLYYNYAIENPFAKNDVPNYFTYVCPVINGKALISETELAPYMGLIYVIDGELIIIRKPKLIHKYKPDIIKLLTKMLTVNNWHHYYGAQKLTILNRETIAANDQAAKENMLEVFRHINKPQRQRHCFKACNENQICECKLQISNTNPY
jgi:hypothetical protein